MIEITEHRLDKMSGYAEELLRVGGRLMQCIEDAKNGNSYGERDDSDRYDMGERENDYYGRMGERRGSRGSRGGNRYY